MSASRHVFVEAPARLHFGMLDLGGSLGRRFGGIGAAVPVPSVLVSARRAPALTVQAGAQLDLDDATSQQVGAAHDAARRVLSHYGVTASAAHVTVHRTIPAHRGLGSGTQIALATARTIAEIYDLPRKPRRWRGPLAGHAARRSAPMRSPTADSSSKAAGVPATIQPAPLLAQSIPSPPLWRCVVAIPAAPRESERRRRDGRVRAAAIAAEPGGGARRRPGAGRSSFPHSSRAISRALAPRSPRSSGSTGLVRAAQGGPFATGAPASLIASLAAAGATGVGQSSWGPAVYALAADAATGAALAVEHARPAGCARRPRRRPVRCREPSSRVRSATRAHGCGTRGSQPPGGSRDWFPTPVFCCERPRDAWHGMGLRAANCSPVRRSVVL